MPYNKEIAGKICGKICGITISKKFLLGSLLNQFKFTSGTAFNFPENSENAVCEIQTNKAGTEIHLGYPAPAPTGITLTPDAVGANPITYYWKAAFGDFGLESIRSQWTEEGTIIIGDDTTEIIAEYDFNAPFWTSTTNILIGQSSGDYSFNKRVGLLNSGEAVWGFNGNFYVDINSSSVEGYDLKYHPIPATYQAPAPTNISITPDAVGANPVTWYYKIGQLTAESKIAELSEEQSYQQGDDTTELILDLDHLDYDDVDLFAVMKGTTSGVYTNMVLASFTPPDGFVPIADVQLPFDLLTGADLPVGEETINGLLVGFSDLLLYYYDNELFEIDGNELKFLSAPDYETPLDTDKDNVYKVLVVASYDGKDIEQEIEITVTLLSQEPAIEWDYEGVLTVGYTDTPFSLYGYDSGLMSGFGSCVPEMIGFVFWSDLTFVGLSKGILSTIVIEEIGYIIDKIEIDGVLFEEGIIGEGTFFALEDNPFPVVGGTHNIKIKVGDPIGG